MFNAFVILSVVRLIWNSLL